MTAAQARTIVEARLGRPAQDELEAAVVLEAWVGLNPRSALELGREIVVLCPRRALAPSSPSELRTPGAEPTRVNEGSVALALLAAVALLVPLAAHFGETTVSRAADVALPLSIGLQWALVRRYLAGPVGVARLRRGAPSAVVLTGLVAGAALTVPSGGPVSAGLVLLWAGAVVVGWRGWGHWYAAATCVIGVPLWLGWFPHEMGFLVMILATLAGAVAAAANAGGEPSRPTPWRRALPSGFTGAGIGLLFVIALPDRVDSTSFLLVLVPYLLGGVWAGRHLSQLWEAVPRALAGTSVQQWRTGLISGLAGTIVAGAVARLAAGTAVASSLVLVVTTATGQPVSVGMVLLLTLMPLGVVALMSALLDAFGRPGWAVGAVAVACLACGLTLAVAPASDGYGGPMFVALAGGMAVAAWPLAEFLREPDRVLATAL